MKITSKFDQLVKRVVERMKYETNFDDPDEDCFPMAGNNDFWADPAEMSQQESEEIIKEWRLEAQEEKINKKQTVKNKQVNITTIVSGTAEEVLKYLMMQQKTGYYTVGEFKTLLENKKWHNKSSFSRIMHNGTVYIFQNDMPPGIGYDEKDRITHPEPIGGADVFITSYFSTPENSTDPINADWWCNRCQTAQTIDNIEIFKPNNTTYCRSCMEIINNTPNKENIRIFGKGS